MASLWWFGCLIGEVGGGFVLTYQDRVHMACCVPDSSVENLFYKLMTLNVSTISLRPETVCRLFLSA